MFTGFCEGCKNLNFKHADGWINTKKISLGGHMCLFLAVQIGCMLKENSGFSLKSLFGL